MAKTLINPASTSRVRVCQVTEVTRGVIPTNPQWKTVPHLVDTNLDSVKSYERSAQVDSTRMGGIQVGGNSSSGGSLMTPAKYDGTVRELMESAFSGTFAHPTKQGVTMAYATNGTYASAAMLISLNPSDGAWVTVNGIKFTFRTVPTLLNDVLIGAALTNTMDNWALALNDSTETELTVAHYTRTGTGTVTALYNSAGTGGNAFTVAWDMLAVTTLKLGGAAVAVAGSGTLSGGAGTADRITDSGNALYALGFRAGQTVTTATSTTTGNNGAYKITAIDPLGGWIELDRDISAAEAFAVGTTLTSNAWFLKAGSTRKFFSHEVSYLDLVPVLYEYYSGNEVNNLTLEVPTSGEVKASYEMVGTDFDETDTAWPLGSGARAAVEDVVPFAASIEGGSFTRDGITQVDTESSTIKIMNNREAKFGVGRETAAFVDQGDFDLEVTASIYFTNGAIRSKYRNGVRMAMAYNFKDQQDGHQMYLEIPRAVVTASPKGKSGNTVTEQCTFFAEKDAVSGTKAMLWFIPGP